MPQTLQSLSVAGVKEALSADAIPVDTRPVDVFTQGFVPGSISLGLEGSFEEWAKALLPAGRPIVVVALPGKEAESAEKLQGAGFGNIAGFLEGGFEAWQSSGEEIDLVIDVEPDELAMDLPFDENILLIDVRRPAEFAEGHVKDAENIPLAEFADLVNIANIEEHQNVYVYCRSGYRSTIAASLFKRHGVHNLRNVTGGWLAIEKENRIEKVKEKPAPGAGKEPEIEEGI